MKDRIIEFLRSKDYKFIRNIGQGGTGKTILIKDENIDENFVCKKYSPYYEGHKEIYYKNFVDEIKLLHLLYHRNVVRVFNYYLYPEQTTGYILMEFIDGDSISVYIKENPDKLNETFSQTISGFRHLEENGILHRDIRPENILVSNNDTVKIIDFGFGKKTYLDDSFNNSISLNWRYPIPEDFAVGIYDYKTEVYFIGKLFQEIIQENNLQNFAYSNVLLQMIDPNPTDRINSFFEVDRKIISDNGTDIEFSYAEQKSYQDFAVQLSFLLMKLENNADYLKDIDVIISSLNDIYRNSMLENIVQNPVAISRCFLKGAYYYDKGAEIKVDVLKSFLQLLRSVSADKKKIILNNIWQRFDKIEHYDNDVNDDLPF